MKRSISCGSALRPVICSISRAARSRVIGTLTPAVGAVEAFAAGADIKEMQEMDFAAMYGGNHFTGWDDFTRTRKPIIAAVAGYALGKAARWVMERFSAGPMAGIGT